MTEIEPLRLEVSGVTALSDLLQTDKPNQDIVVRKGTPADIPEGRSINETTKNSFIEVKDGRDFEQPNTVYTQEEFDKEFGEDVELLDYDSDPRKVAHCNIVERITATVEQSAGTMSSMDVLGGNRKSLVYKMRMPREDPKTIDIDVERTTLFSTPINIS